MGKRRLRSWLKQPLVGLEDINTRHTIVEAAVEDTELRQRLRCGRRREGGVSSVHLLLYLLLLWLWFCCWWCLVGGRGGVSNLGLVSYRAHLNNPTSYLEWTPDKSCSV